MKLIYVAGKYKAKTEWGLEENIRHAEDVARKLWKQGWAVICPHKNTAHFGGLLEDPQEDWRMWIDGDLEIISRCDAIFMLKGWEHSNGACEEFKLAKKLGLELHFEEKYGKV